MKLNRAITHLESLKKEIQVIEKSDLAVLVHEYDSNVRKNFWKWQRVADEPITQLSPIVGDVFANASDCLDHIMYAFLGGTMCDRSIYWPFSKTTHAWSSDKGRLKRLPPEALTIIESYQPPKRPNCYKPTLMAVLHETVIISKHRRLILIGLPVVGAANSGGVTNMTYAPMTPPKTGAIFASADGEEVDMPLRPLLRIAFGESGRLNNQPPIRTLSEILHVVEGALNQFEQKFSS